MQPLFAGVETLFVGQQLRDAERSAARDDRDLVNQVDLRQQPGHQGVAGLVVGSDLLFAFVENVLSSGTEQDLVAGQLEIFHLDRILGGSGCQQGCLVDQVPQVGAEKPMVPEEILSRSTSSASGTRRQWTFRIPTRPSRLGRSMVTWRSNRPGRSNAGSSTSGRLVAASTITASVCRKPSISLKI